VSLIRKFRFHFSPKHFLIGDTATTKEVVVTGFSLWQSQHFNRNAYAREAAPTKVVVIIFTGFQLWQSQRFNRHDTYAREVLFWQGSGFRFRPSCFYTTRFGSARLGAREG